MNNFSLTLFLAMLTASAQPGLAPPRLGFIAAADHSLRPVLGLSGNLLLGSPAAEGVSSAGWSGSFGLIKTSSSLMAFDPSHTLASIDAVPGPALFAFSASGSPAFALLPQSGVLYAWTGETFQTAPFQADLLDGKPLAIASPQAGVVSLIVQREDGLWLIQPDRQSALPGIQPPVLLQNDGTVLYVDKTAIVIRNAAGNERRIETGISISEMHWMGSGWLHVLEATTTRQFAIRITPGSETITQLPEAR